MSDKFALIVDDSKIACLVLGKMLKEQGIDFDSVQSGEDALGFLCNRTPDMIFMDHTMPGMDGFQTIRAIRNDPRNARIPIMMYTSKEGEVYVSQARAMGATAVLAKKKLKAEQLVSVLQGQNLMPGQTREDSATPLPRQASARAPEDAIVQSFEDDIQEVTKAVEESIRPRAAAPVRMDRLLGEIREQITQSHLTSIDSLSQKIEQRLTALEERLTNSDSRRPSTMSDRSRFLRLGGLLLGGIVFWLALSAWQQQTQLMRSVNQNMKLEDKMLASVASGEDYRTTLERELRDNAYAHIKTTSRLYALIGDLLTRDAHFGWDQSPFNDRLASMLENVTNELDEVGFRGDITLRSHLGRFCVKTNGNGEQVLPGERTPVSDCEIIDLEGSNADVRGMQQTTRFGNVLAAIEARYGDRIRIQLETAGSPRLDGDYPDITEGMTAGQWNAMAARQQRVEFIFTGTR
jgi:CheY-like chemotaxis protein